jgi:hypothetical protein
MSNDNFAPGWAERIEAAQRQTHIQIGGKTYPRRPYGGEYPGSTLKPLCRDCGVTHGQLHVLSCCVERCPACGGQALSCLCPDGEALVTQ